MTQAFEVCYCCDVVPTFYYLKVINRLNRSDVSVLTCTLLIHTLLTTTALYAYTLSLCVSQRETETARDGE